MLVLHLPQHLCQILAISTRVASIWLTILYTLLMPLDLVAQTGPAFAPGALGITAEGSAGGPVGLRGVAVEVDASTRQSVWSGAGLTISDHLDYAIGARHRFSVDDGTSASVGGFAFGGYSELIWLGIEGYGGTAPQSFGIGAEVALQRRWSYFHFGLTAGATARLWAANCRWSGCADPPAFRLLPFVGVSLGLNLPFFVGSVVAAESR